MLYQNEESNQINNTEVLLPSEFNQEDVAVVPGIVARCPMDMPVECFAEALIRREDNRNALLRWIKSNLHAGTDFGQIHVFGKDKCKFAKEGRTYECTDQRHWSKPSLWKPGAEKICGMLGLVPRFPSLNEYEKAAMRGEDIKVIIIKCKLMTGTGFVAGEGTGARRFAQDDGDINKSIKMAEKSAHIDATLRIAGLSELFTQDIEDMNHNVRDNLPPDTNRQEDATSTSRQPSGNPQSERDKNNNGSRQTNSGGSITSKQYKFILDLIDNAGISEQELNAHSIETYGAEVDYISCSDASSLIAWLKSR